MAEGEGLTSLQLQNLIQTARAARYSGVMQ